MQNIVHNSTNDSHKNDLIDEQQIPFCADANSERDQILSHTYNKSKKIRILSQNLWCHYLAPSPFKSDRLYAFISFLQQRSNDYDILIIQEIFALRFAFWVRSNELEFLVCELYKLGFVYHTKPSGHLPYFGQNGGVMIFSKYPFVFDNVFRFQFSDELLLRKGFAIGIAKIPLNEKRSEFYHLCVGTAHCDPYRPKVILSQIEHFAKEIKLQTQSNKSVGDKQKIDVVVGGDFNTRNEALIKGLKQNFESTLGMYNGWNLNDKDHRNWNTKFVTYRKAKKKVWLSILSCGLYKLPTAKEVKSKKGKGHCLDHLLTNVNPKWIQNVSVVDTEWNDVFVSDHLGVEMVINVSRKNVGI